MSRPRLRPRRLDNDFLALKAPAAVMDGYLAHQLNGKVSYIFHGGPPIGGKTECACRVTANQRCLARHTKPRQNVLIARAGP